MEELFWDGHRDRLRLKVEEKGLNALKDREALELMLYFASPRADMAEVCQALLDRFETLGGVFRATRAELLSISGMSRVLSDWVQITGELVDAYVKADKSMIPRIWCFRDMVHFLAPRWYHVPAPQTWMLYTDYEDYVMTYIPVCESLYWWDPGYITQIVMEAMSLEARHAFMIMFMGIEPLELDGWEEDCLTAFACTMRAINVELMDCVLVGHHGYRSLNSEGYLDISRLDCLAEVGGLHERYLEDSPVRGTWEDA